MDDSFKVLIKLFLPDSVEDYFELTHHKKEGENLHIYLKELST
jgi:hypothetical protein